MMLVSRPTWLGKNVLYGELICLSVRGVITNTLGLFLQCTVKPKSVGICRIMSDTSTRDIDFCRSQEGSLEIMSLHSHSKVLRSLTSSPSKGPDIASYRLSRARYSLTYPFEGPYVASYSH